MKLTPTFRRRFTFYLNRYANALERFRGAGGALTAVEAQLERAESLAAMRVAKLKLEALCETLR